MKLVLQAKVTSASSIKIAITGGHLYRSSDLSNTARSKEASLAIT
jgi:hypothetical protein